jgi:hypothetical protein
LQILIALISTIKHTPMVSSGLPFKHQKGIPVFYSRGPRSTRAYVFSGFIAFRPQLPHLITSHPNHIQSSRYRICFKLPWKRKDASSPSKTSGSELSPIILHNMSSPTERNFPCCWHPILHKRFESSSFFRRTRQFSHSDGFACATTCRLTSGILHPYTSSNCESHLP